ncbi:MAG: hypothetical protein HXY25_07150 [Alphaproteobacteria bacterium]|nr:hypothetical protein [Alphaproteobacteria bacterium]
MRYRIFNIVALVAILVGIAGFELGALAASDGFFAVFFGIALYTASQLAARDGMPLGQAIGSLWRDPSSYATRRTGQLAYLGSVAAGLLVVTQIAVF